MVRLLRWVCCGITIVLVVSVTLTEFGSRIVVIGGVAGDKARGRPGMSRQDEDRLRRFFIRRSTHVFRRL